MAKYVYPAIFAPEEGAYNVSFPDLPECYTCGDDLADALYMAQDALGGYLSRAEEMHAEIPAAAAPGSVIATGGATVSLIRADTEAYRRAHSNRAVKKTLTIPSWLNEAAEAQSVNFSQLLQDALKSRLGL